MNSYIRQPSVFEPFPPVFDLELPFNFEDMHIVPNAFNGVSGTANVVFNSNGAWDINLVLLDGEGGWRKCGLLEFPELAAHLIARLKAVYSASIETDVVAALEERFGRRDPNAEHRLTARELV